MAFEINAAKKFVSSVNLADIPRPIIPKTAGAEAGEVFDKAKAQARVVGSGVFSFAQGVDVAVREAISDSALLAQLVANKEVAFEHAPQEWFTAYAKVLQNVGWTVQEGGWAKYTVTGQAVAVNEKIIEIMTAILAPSAAALSIITSTVNALKAMDSNSSWFTIFSRESQKAKVARFQIGLVEKGKDAEVFVALLACLIEANTTITQVLVFRYNDAIAKFAANSSKVSINRHAVTELGPIIRDKIRAYQAYYLSSIKDV
jgi:hypothetical protein